MRAMFTLLVSMSYCSSRAANIEFTATFIAATCKVSAPALLDFGNVSISCGECDDSLTRSGTLSATLTFNFVYQ